MGLLIAGASVDVPGLVALCPLDPGGPPHTPHVYKGNGPFVQPITGIVVHTSEGDPDCHVPRSQSDGAPIVSPDEHIAWANAHYYGRRDIRSASAHAFVSEKGTVLCIADLAAERTWHVGECNPWTIGIEMAQAKPAGGGFVYDATYRATAALVAHLCERFGIPKRYPAVAGMPARGVCKALDCDHGGAGGKHWPGVWGHRNSTRNRGQYDPGGVFWGYLDALGFVGVDPDVVS